MYCFNGKDESVMNVEEDEPEREAGKDWPQAPCEGGERGTSNFEKVLDLVTTGFVATSCQEKERKWVCKYKSKVSRRKEILKIRAEINEKERKEQ